MPDNKIWSRDLITKVLVLVSRPGGQGLGLGLETWWPRSWSWSRDLVAKVLVLVSRPGGQGLGLGLETWWSRSWSWSRAFFKGLDNKSGIESGYGGVLGLLANNGIVSPAWISIRPWLVN